MILSNISVTTTAAAQGKGNSTLIQTGTTDTTTVRHLCCRYELGRAYIQFYIQFYFTGNKICKTYSRVYKSI